jgi:predicted secreted protein with PEFG-CTERM motif
MAEADVTINLATPPPPTITIISPTEDEFFNSLPTTLKPSYVEGSVSVPGGLTGFCIKVNDASTPFLQQCNQASLVGLYNNFITNISSSSLKPGLNTIYVFAYDRWGQIGESKVDFIMPVGFQITGMEVTQGIQTMNIAINTGGPQNYEGVKLISGGKTVVRVFANIEDTGNYQMNVSMLLCPFSDDITSNNASGCLYPDYTPNIIPGGSGVSYAQRADPNGAYVFTLPYWLTNSPNLTLQAKINVNYTGGAQYAECSNCPKNDDFILNNIQFSNIGPITIVPVEIVWTDPNGNLVTPSDPVDVFSRTASIMPIPEGGLLVKPYQHIVDVTDLKNELDSGQITREDFESQVGDHIVHFANNPNAPGGNIIGISHGLDVGLEWPQVFWFLQERNLAIADEGGGEMHASTDSITPRPLTGVTHELFHEFNYYHAGANCPSDNLWILWPPDNQGYIQGVGLDRRDGSGTMPGTYRIIAPTLGNNFDLYLDTSSGNYYQNISGVWWPILTGSGDPDSTVGNSKLNNGDFYYNNFYYLDTSSGNYYQNISGVWTRQGTTPNLTGGIQLIKGTGNPAWVDFMSYCIDFSNYVPANGDYNAWISVKNWNAFNSEYPNGIVPDSATTSTATVGGYTPEAIPNTGGNTTIRVDAVVNSTGGLNILSVEHGNGKYVTNGTVQSPWKVVLYDQTGKVVSSNYFMPTIGHVHGKSPHTFVNLNAEVLADNATHLQILHNNNVVAERFKSPNVPIVTLSSPNATTHIFGSGQTLISWNASDADGNPLESIVEYSTDDGKTFSTLFVGPNKNQISLPNQFFTGSNQARIRIDVNDGFNDAYATSDRFVVDGSPPIVHVLDPANNTKIPPNVSLHLVGQAFNDLSGLVPDTSYHWYIANQMIGTGIHVQGPKLQPGVYTVTLQASDEMNRTGSTTISIQVVPEFGSVAPIIFAISILSIIVLSVKNRFVLK